MTRSVPNKLDPLIDQHESDKQFGKLVEQITQQFEADGQLDEAALLHAHPEYAERLSHLLPTMRAMLGWAVADGNGEHVVSNPGGVETSKPADFGDFRILRELGRGGMGVVYLAEQISLHRQVALKILPLAAVMDPRQLIRFRNEVQTVALLQHQNIVPVYSVGSERGIHFFAMRYVEGPTLAEVIAQLRQLEGIEDKKGGPTDEDSRLSKINEALTQDFTAISRASGAPHETVETPRTSRRPWDGPSIDTEPLAAMSTSLSSGSKAERFRSIARLMIQAAEALDHAHSRGVVHRDVKPGNLMIDPTGNLWVTDFGLARFEADAGITMTGDIVGTLRYMSPERALAKRVVTDHRTDIYSLGVTLFELLTLQPAHQGADRQELLKQIAFEEPRAARKIDAAIPVELETITRKSIEKDPTDRYETAQAMADDLRRYLDDRPILARPPSLSDQAAKWSRRHVGIVWTLVLASLALAVACGVGAALIADSRDVAEQEREQAERERGAAVEQRNDALRNEYYAEMSAGQMELASGNPGGLYDRLINYLPLGAVSDDRDWEWYYLMSHCRPEIRTFGSAARFAAWSPDGQYIGTPGAIWDAKTGDQIRRLNTSKILPCRVAWSPDGKKFAWGMASDESAIYVWDRNTDRVSRLAGHESSVWSVAWSPDGSQIASGAIDHTVKIWDVASGTVQSSVSVTDNVTSLAWSPDGKLLAAGFQYRGGIQVWDVAEWKLLHEGTLEGQSSVSWHPQGNVLAACDARGWYLVDRSDWSVKHVQKIDQSGLAIAYSPNGSQLAVAHVDKVTIWDAEGETQLAQLNGHLWRVQSISWAPDGRRLVTADEGRVIKLWDLDQPDQPPPIRTDGFPDIIEWLDDNQTLAVVELKRGLSLSSSSWWNARDGSLERRENVPMKRPWLPSPDLRLAAVPLEDGDGLSILDASTGKERFVLRVDPGTSYAVALSPATDRES